MSRHPGPTIERIVPDKDCLEMSAAGQLRLFKDAKCPDGRTLPRLTVYEEGRCRGEVKRGFYATRFLGMCTPICDGKRSYSVKVRCDVWSP